MKIERSISEVLGETPPNEPASFTFTLERGLLAGRKIQADLRICPVPICGCEFAEFICTTVGSAGEEDSKPRHFSVDISKRTVGTKSEGDVRASRRLGEALVTELTEPDWEAMGRFFRASKLRCIETANDVKEFAALSEAGIRSENTLLSYTEVFPWADQPEFKRDGDVWFIADHYCLAPDCPCTGANLNFVRIVGGQTDPAGPTHYGGGLYLDYATGESSRLDTKRGQPSPDALLMELRAACPDLATILRKRHERLKPLGKLLYTSDPLAPEARPAPSSPTVRVGERVGRNAPCPCGSGKKFKKCCGA